MSEKDDDERQQSKQIKTTRLKKQIKKTSAGERTEVMMSPAAQLFQSLPNVDMNDHFFEILVTENLGIHVQPGRDEKNAFVQKVTSEATKENGVKKGQQLVAINGRSILDLKFDQIRSIVSYTMKRTSGSEGATLRFMKKPRIVSQTEEDSGSFEVIALAMVIIFILVLVIILALDYNFDFNTHSELLSSFTNLWSSQNHPHQHHGHHHHDNHHDHHHHQTQEKNRNNVEKMEDDYPFPYDPYNSKPETESVTLSVKLEQVYTASQVSFRPPRGIQKICDACGGNGALHGNSDYIKVCPHCHGTGVEIVNMQLAPGFVQRMETTCSHCGGSGTIIRHKCRKCGGEGVNIDKNKIHIHVPKGIEDGGSMTLYAKGHQIPNHPPGDIHVTFRINQHKKFKRSGNDLRYALPISLKESLLGFAKQIKHLDGHYVEIESSTVQNCESEILIKNEGMCDEYDSCGNLIVNFEIQFPRNVDQEKIRNILKVDEKSSTLKKAEIIFNKKDDY